MKRLYLVVFFLGLLLPGIGQAMTNGKELLSRCEVTVEYIGKSIVELDKAFKAGYCSAWVESVITQLYTFGEEVPGIKVCLPLTRGGEPMDIVRGVRVLTDYLRKHPDRLNESSYPLTIEAFSKAFPCN